MPKRFLIASLLKALLLTVIVVTMTLAFGLGHGFLALLGVMIPMWIALDWIAYRRDNPKA